ncbi:FecR domain-containing protein [Paucibacter sp. AS339]|uniref:FecR domain-containing protein n=1 Tax=Paucibacter hankyongi TaxID=3133434 RepID=UPI0030AED433
MPLLFNSRLTALATMAALLSSLSAPSLHAAEISAKASIGQVKRLSGTVMLDRGGQVLTPQPGMSLQEGDRLRTGADGLAGVTLSDDSLLTAGPNSSLLISSFSFNTTTHDGALQAKLGRGSLHVVTGLIAKKAPEKVNFQARSVVLGVRGTEFIVDVGGAEE